jgi:hypothetical protein
MKIYQLVAFVNGYNKRKKQWESLHRETIVLVGREGLKYAYHEFEHQKREVDFWLQQKPGKYREFRGKVEIQIPHVHSNGQLAYWGNKLLHSYNPLNI